MHRSFRPHTQETLHISLIWLRITAAIRGMRKRDEGRKRKTGREMYFSIFYYCNCLMLYSQIVKVTVKAASVQKSQEQIVLPQASSGFIFQINFLCSSWFWSSSCCGNNQVCSLVLIIMLKYLSLSQGTGLIPQHKKHQSRKRDNVENPA